ncbi:uncharacterized protein LOC114723504 [Neltuma alba]|uniref:uncharacterized protein LOC114723504 n=1 Tax=Neltuma alba TaxID=207710 RepID=UPI0010A3659C|nr:uncharacterized protein LOC114723504 [Prosopis alba]
MRLPPRRVLTPANGPSAPNKRKDRDESFDPPKPSSSVLAKMLKPDHKPRPGSEPPASSNQLLAGYLAHEFLTRGTLFGQPWDPPYRAEGGPTEKLKGQVTGSEGEEAKAPPEKRERYIEVADLLKEEGPHLPGIVNPTQLGRFLQL